jgi:hypothetical protein
LDAGSVLNTATASGTDLDDQIVADETSRAVNAAGVCQPEVVTADFSQVGVGETVEGLGKVAPYLSIDARGTAVKILEGTAPDAFGSPNDAKVMNGGIAANGGFVDIEARQAGDIHRYVFTFTGTSVSEFSLHMLDYGDWNVPADASHYVEMVAYNGNGAEVDRQELTYTSPEVTVPRSSDIYGDLWFSGDASGLPGQPGNWTWNVTGSGIVQVVLEFGSGYDTAIGFDTLTFTTECNQ